MSRARDKANSTVSNFASTGIDDNADATAITIDSSENVGIGETAPVTPLTIATTNKLGSTFTGTTNGEGLTVTQTDYSAGNYVSLVEAAYDDSNDSNPNVRIGAMFDGGGSNLAFGTSNSFGSGITNTAMFINSSGNVGIGGTPTELLYLQANNPEFAMQAATDGGECAIYFKDDDGNKDGRITYRTDYAGQTDNFMSFFTNGSERFRVLGGGGITFNGDTAAANALDDYEEGTWTPTVYGSSTAGSYTYTTTGNSPYANYTKIGRTVTLQVMLNNITQSSAGSGDVFIGGLPFNKMAGSAPFGCVHLNNWNTTGTITGVTVHPTTFANSGDVLQLTLDFDNSSSNSLSLSHLNSGSSDIGFSLVYFTA